MAVYRAGETPEAGSSGAPDPSLPQRRWTARRIGSVVSAVGAVGALALAVASPQAAATTTPSAATPPTVTFTDQCDGTVSLEIVNPEGNADIAVSYGTPADFLSVYTSQTPELTDFNDSLGVTLGTWIQTSAAGQVHGIRWYFPQTLPTTEPIGVLYSATGTELARATFSSPTAGAWNEALFASPVAIGAGDLVVAAVYTPDTYVATVGFFSSSGLTNGVLSAPATDSVSPGNGVFTYSGGDAAFPNSTFNGAGYFADVLFTEGGVVEADGVPHVITVPAGVGEIAVTGAGVDETHTWSKPPDCPGATVAFVDNCDGTVAVTVTNPVGNDDVVVSWSGGSETVVDDGQPHVIDVPAAVGQITVTGAGLDETHAWSAAGTSGCTCEELGNCPTTTPVPETSGPTTDHPGSSTGTLPNLPKTGSNLVGLLWAGAALLLSGIALLLFVSDSRSRRDRRSQA